MLGSYMRVFTVLYVPKINWTGKRVTTVSYKKKSSTVGCPWELFQDHQKRQELLKTLVTSLSVKQHGSIMKLFRDGPLEMLWGGGEGNFRAAGIFFVTEFLV